MQTRPIRRLAPRAVGFVVLVAATLVLAAPPASAHNVAGVGATNYETTLDGVSPETDGITVAVVEAGSRLELTNTSDQDVVVLGYQDEPYLRIGPDGVFENQRSPATYLNRDRTGSQAAPDSADPEADPDWKKLSSSQTARWHDHRIHWMGGDVNRPDERFVVEDHWVVPLDYGSERLEVTGQLLWVPGPSALPWWGIVLALLLVGVVIGMQRWWGKGLALLLAALILVDLTHLVGILGATAGGPNLGAVGPSLLYSVVGWGVGVVGVVLLWRGKRDGLFTALFAGVLLAVFGGLSDSSVLDHSQVPFAWSAGVARLLVTLTMGLGAAVTAGAIAAMSKLGVFGKASIVRSPKRVARGPAPRDAA
jgi:hypothetical protein